LTRYSYIQQGKETNEHQSQFHYVTAILTKLLVKMFFFSVKIRHIEKRFRQKLSILRKSKFHVLHMPYTNNCLSEHQSNLISALC